MCKSTSSHEYQRLTRQGTCQQLRACGVGYFAAPFKARACIADPHPGVNACQVPGTQSQVTALQYLITNPQMATQPTQKGQPPGVIARRLHIGTRHRMHAHNWFPLLLSALLPVSAVCFAIGSIMSAGCHLMPESTAPWDGMH